MRRGLSLMAVLLITATAAMPQADNKFARMSLRGLIGVEVVVDELTPEAEADGLGTTAIQTDVELKLRQSGIKVLTREQGLAAPGMPVLYIRVATYRSSEAPVYAVFVEVELEQAVRLEREPSVRVRVVRTWNARGFLGTVGRQRLPTVRDNVKDQVDQFVNAWLSVNPK